MQPLTTSQWEELEKEADEDLEAGRYSDFDTIGALLEELDSYVITWQGLFLQH